MSNAKTKMLVIFSALFLVLVGLSLYTVFDRQGFGEKKQRKVISYNIKDYTETTSLAYDNYTDVYTSIKVSRISIKNIANDEITSFLEKENEFLGYIDDYYNEMKKDNYTPVSSVESTTKAQINGTVLSVYYEVDFNLDEDIFEDDEKKYITTINIDLATEKVLSIDDLLSKYSYTKEYISEKLFEEDIMISDGEVVIDKNTNISYTKSDVVRKKEVYVNGIINEFDNIMEVYIENSSLVIVYDTKELKGLFFDNYFDTNIKTRYLK